MSRVPLKNAAELELQRQAGQLLAQVFAYLEPLMRSGVTTMQINDWVER